MDRTHLAIAAASLANIGLAAAKFVGFAFTGSASLLAEACHSLADTTNQILLVIGRARSRRRETPTHPFGYGAERFFWAFLVAVFMLVGGAFVAIFRGVSALLAPEPIDHPGWGLGILVAALLFDGGSLLVAARSATRRRGEGWLRYVRRTVKPEVPVILLEDSTSLAGTSLALLALGLTALTGNPLFDALGSLAIGLLLTVMALFLAREIQSLLIGESASPETQALVAETLREDPTVMDLVYVRTLHLGPEELFVEAKVVMDPDISVREVALAIDRIEAILRARVPETRVISIEPDIPRPDDPDRPRFDHAAE